MAFVNPGPTKDSDYSRKYIKQGVYPVAARSVSASAIHNNVSRQYPWYGEFSKNHIEPSRAIQRAYEVFMRQSEFKKPYWDRGYHEMETNSDPAPGITSNRFDMPGNPRLEIGEPIVPEGAEGVDIVFQVFIDPGYEEGGYCRGNTVNCLFHATEPIYGVTVTYSQPGTSVSPTSSFGFNDLYLDITADNGEFGFITIEFLMRTVEGVGAEVNVNVFGKVCEEYVVIELSEGGTDKVTVWGMLEDAVVSNIPTNDLLGVVTFPADFSEIATWLSLASPLAENTLVSQSVPSWIDSSLSINTPTSPDNGNSCSTTLNSYAGGSWPIVDINDTPTSGGDGEGCDAPSLENQNFERWEYKRSVNCPAGTAKNDPYIEIQYWEGNWIRRAQHITGELVSNNLVPATQVFRTELIGHSYNYWTESADYTHVPPPAPPPIIPTSLGGGSYSGFIHFDYNIYTPLDAAPIVAEHTVDVAESWSKTFELNGTVSGFTRSFVATAIPRSNYAKVIAQGFSQIQIQGSIYGRHTALQIFIWEALKVSANSAYAGGSVGNLNFNDWENNANFGVTDEDIYQGVHAAAVFEEETYTDNLDACTLTRHGGLESAVEDLIDDFKTDAGLGSDDTLQSGTTLGLTILL